MNCPGSVNLCAQYPNVETVFAAEGTALHEAIDLIFQGKTEKDTDVIGLVFNGHEITILESLYERAGVELTPGVRKSFERYLGSNPRGKHGSIRYDLQRHFGMTPEDVRSRFDFYFDRFDVRPEVGVRPGEN
jgi:hypothetical protein